MNIDEVPLQNRIPHLENPRCMETLHLIVVLQYTHNWHNNVYVSLFQQKLQKAKLKLCIVHQKLVSGSWHHS